MLKIVKPQPDTVLFGSLNQRDTFIHANTLYMKGWDAKTGTYVAMNIEDAEVYPLSENLRVVPACGTLTIEPEKP